VLPTATRIGDIIVYMVSQALGLTAAVAAMLLSAFAAAQTIADGDTIKHNGTTYRLWASTRPRLGRRAPTAGRPVPRQNGSWAS